MFALSLTTCCIFLISYKFFYLDWIGESEGRIRPCCNLYRGTRVEGEASERSGSSVWPMNVYQGGRTMGEKGGNVDAE